MSGSLDDFFAEMAGLLDGTRTAAECETALGASPSGTERLGVYRTLVARQHRGALDSLFRATLIAADAWDPVRSAALRTSFLAAHPPAHWSPSVVAAPFADFLASHAASEDVVELADFARTRFEVLRAAADVPLQTIAVRHYTHDVHVFTAQVEREGRTDGRPARVASTLILARHLETADFLMIAASLPMIIALHLAEVGQWSAELPLVDRADVVAAASSLAELGVIDDATRAQIHAVAT